MKKLSLDDLKVDSYSVQLSENELAAIKGGTLQACWYLETWGPAAVALGVEIYNYYYGDPEASAGASGGSSSGGVSVTMYGSGGSVTVKNRFNESITIQSPTDSLSMDLSNFFR